MIWKVKSIASYWLPHFLLFISRNKHTGCVPMLLFALPGKLYFIDFEYGSYSYRGYDIANHFNEYAGFDCDYDM